MRFMDSRTEIRLPKQLLKDIEKETYLSPEKYMNNSHFIRVAIIKELRKAKNERNKKT